MKLRIKKVLLGSPFEGVARWAYHRLNLSLRKVCLQGLRYYSKLLGIRGAFAYLYKEQLLEQFFRVLSWVVGCDLHPTIYRLYSRDSKFPLLCRYGTSDRNVFSQIFVEREYSCLDDASDPRFIVDCGAYVGYSSAYFLTRFPNAQVVAIEPDRANFEMLQRNMNPYGNRVSMLYSAVWSHKAGLVVCRGQYRDGREWTTQVREHANNEEPDISAIDIGSLLEQSAFQRIDILKVDIERAEAVVFARNYEDWIDRIDTFLIELHDNECREVFLNALQSGRYKFSRSGELTVAQRVGTSRL